jgi:hypothetical protein
MNLPLDLRFKTFAVSPQIAVTDARGEIVLYARQKAFKLKESITVFGDAAQTRALYRIDADRVLDFGARYTVVDADSGETVGTVRRQGMRSIWRAHYDLERDGAPALEVREENPWLKVADQFVSEIPLIGLVSGYLLNPAYRVTRPGAGDALLRMRKEPSFLESRYSIKRVGTAAGDDDDRLAVLGLLMIVLLERRRG